MSQNDKMISIRAIFKFKINDDEKLKLSARLSPLSNR